ncbi:hypothetical protein C5167_009824 [Papaver somniferum]|uniref:Pectinesterase n=1 Tax=Papaver somniferum TaxID=3469 RepID=A0A4Y7JZM8_PAPSO|nr:probable pectinesterase/pectinesterase inhibitor 51 isoform X1 [Papaver somniferum]RZC66137.1 hypothetical protein C5167_009824 [Papaver somniferum]
MAANITIFILFCFLFSVRGDHLQKQSHHKQTHISKPNNITTTTATTITTTDIISQVCNATRFPDTCKTALTKAGNLSSSSPVDIIKTSFSISAHKLRKSKKLVKTILDASSGNQNRSVAAQNCLKVLQFSEYRFSLAANTLPRGKLKDARAWTSAALLYQVDCWSALSKVNDSPMVNDTVSFMNWLTELTSNVLSMLVGYDRFGNETGSWKPPMTERNGVWEMNSGGGIGGVSTKRGFPVNLPANATVCKEKNSGCYTSIQDAVFAAPDYAEGVGRFVIKIKEGVYSETVRIPLKKRNVVFLGDGTGKTVITGSLNVGQPGVSTYNTATVGVLGDGFMARDITFENTAGPDAHQAVAFRSDSDQSIIENCEFLGHQDTLYARALRQLYNSCRIEGTVDFIFGNSAAVFQNSVILIRPRQLSPEHGETNAVTAHGRTDPGQSTGFVFQNCLINGTDEYMKLYYENPKVHRNYLGRPWKEYSRTVFIDCHLESLIAPEGWMPWDGDYALSTLYYGESDNSGPGANSSLRVPWSSQIPSEYVSTYSLGNFIQSGEWMSLSF